LDDCDSGWTAVRWAGLILGLLISHSGWAVEFGPPKALSGRGEPLQIVIPMSGITPGTETAYFPLLAPQTAFDQRQLVRDPQLNRLRYRVNPIGEGRAELVVTTRDAWQSGSVNTLIEIYSPVGAIIRPLQIAIPQRLRSASPPVVMTPPEALEPPTQSVLETVPTEPTALSKPMTEGASVALEATSEVRVASGMTLWRIAERVRPEGLTMEQVMMALYAENPDAFEYGNVNALEKDRMLTIPSAVRMAAIEPRGAERDFKAHMAEPKRDFRSAAVETPVGDRTTAIAPIRIEGERVDLPNTRVAERAPVEATLAETTANANAISGTEALVRDPEPVEPASDTPISVPASVAALSPVPDAGTPLAPSVIAETPVPVDPEPSEVVTAVEAPPPAIASEDRLVGRISELESKLTAVDARISELIDTITVAPTPSVTQQAFTTAPTAEPAVAVTTPTWIEWLRRPEILGALAGAAFLILLLIWRTTAPVATPAPRTTAVQSPAKPLQPVSPERVVATKKDPLLQAIETVQHKLVEPHATEKTESLYRLEDEEALLAAFSADALNEHPEWGDDPDDEADLAGQQLEMVASYLERGMCETALELLQRVAISPDRDARTKASQWLTELQSKA